MVDYIVPLLILVACAAALGRKKDPYTALLTGGEEGLKLVLQLVPTLVMLLTAVRVLRVSGAVDWLATVLAPAFRFAGIPPETALLVLIRPISGSAALAVGAELMTQYGVDSLIGRTVAVMLGSTETTFYVISMYFGAAGIRKARYALLAALLADLTGFIVAAASVRLLFR